jgi:hypothetical protein
MSPRSRLLALVATALGVWLTRGQLVTTNEALVVSPVLRVASVGSRLPRSADSSGSPRVAQSLPVRASLEEGLSDPFALPRVAVKVPPPPAPIVIASVQPGPPAPPPAPRVPYRFVGLLSENGKSPSVYLALGEKLIEARSGDVLEGGFQLKSITTKELSFLHQQSNMTVRLAVDGEPL